MIPTLITVPNSPWMLLPPGVHPSTLDEVATRFLQTPHRNQLFQGLVEAALNLKSAGCRFIYLDGSFVSDKPLPEDYDACWDASGVNGTLLDPVLLDFSNLRAAQKAKYKGEFFISTSRNQPHQTFLDFFQVDRHSGSQKGILSIDLLTDPLLVRRSQ